MVPYQAFLFLLLSFGFTIVLHNSPDYLLRVLLRVVLITVNLSVPLQYVCKLWSLYFFQILYSIFTFRSRCLLEKIGTIYKKTNVLSKSYHVETKETSKSINARLNMIKESLPGLVIYGTTNLKKIPELLKCFLEKVSNKFKGHNWKLRECLENVLFPKQ